MGKLYRKQNEEEKRGPGNESGVSESVGHNSITTTQRYSHLLVPKQNAEQFLHRMASIWLQSNKTA